MNIIGNDKYIMVYPCFDTLDIVDGEPVRKTGIEILRSSDIVAIYYEQKPEKQEDFRIVISWRRKDKKDITCNMYERYESLEDLEKRMMELEKELNWGY